MQIRHADPERDAAGCLRVYSPFVNGSPVSFEDRAPSEAEFAKRITRLGRTHAFLVAADDERIAGFAYAGTYRERSAYRWSCEATIYLDPSDHRRGLGRALYAALFGLLERQGYRTVLAAIAIPNDASIRLHEACGFTSAGVFRQIGWKDGDWLDVAWLALKLGATLEHEPLPRLGPPARLSEPIEFEPR